MTDQDDPTEDGDDAPSDGPLLRFLRSFAITPAEARKIVAQYAKKARSKHPNADERECQRRIADLIVGRYAKLTAFSGGASGLIGVVPGLGTALSMLGGGLADVAICFKLQVDLCLCLACLFRHDLGDEDVRHLSFLLAACTSLEKVGAEATTKIASEAGVKLIQQYMRGAVLQVIKELFKKLGVVFTRKALEKSLPFGVGVLIGGTANYALTKYVGREAKAFFVIQQDG